MPPADRDVLRYAGNVVDDIIWMAENGHLFGPDMCGDSRVNWEDTCNSFTLGTDFANQTVRLFAASVLPRGAVYELQDAQYDPVNNRTTAWFKPKVNPLKNVRYHGGQEDPDRAPLVPGRGRAARADKVRAR